MIMLILVIIGMDFEYNSNVQFLDCVVRFGIHIIGNYGWFPDTEPITDFGSNKEPTTYYYIVSGFVKR